MRWITLSRGLALHSAIYEGQVRHSRATPVPHAFEYRLFMMYLDLAELDEVDALRDRDDQRSRSEDDRPTTAIAN